MSAADRLGVVIVGFNSADVILQCLDSLFTSDAAERLRVVVVDNNSTDDTREAIRAWAAGTRLASADPAGSPVFGIATKPLALNLVTQDEKAAQPAPLTLLQSRVNGGYAYGVNAGIAFLRDDPQVCGYWVLNPDCVVPPQTPGRYLQRLAAGANGMLSSRCLYFERPDIIQTDGGHVSRWTGVCHAANAGRPAAGTPLPQAAGLDFVTGANLVVPRSFVDEVGLMHEDYFLYYEEVDWAFRRGGRPLELVPGAEIYHRGGTSIGSATGFRQASPFSLFFNHRNRLRFVGRHFAMQAPIAFAWTLAKAAQLLLKAGPAAARATLAGAAGRPPPRDVSDRIADAAARRLAFGGPAAPFD